MGGKPMRIERELEAETAANSQGRPALLESRYVWPNTGEVETVATAIPRWIVETGCTYHEALARCGISPRTAERWMYVGGGAFRDVADGKIDPDQLDTQTARCMRFWEAVAAACAEVVVRWQSILEREATGGFEITRRTVREKRNAAGELIERYEETVTETARPNVDVVMWKMRKQLERYREKPLIFVGTSPLDIPEPTDEEVAGSAVVSLTRFQEAMRAKRAGAIEASGQEA